jgi:hypothetical protein
MTWLSTTSGDGEAWGSVCSMTEAASDVELLDAVAGYLFFTDAGSFRAYVRKEILAAEPTGVS